MTDRERFEEWAQSQGEDSASFVSGIDGRYRSPTLEGEWRIWQAAVAAESARRDALDDHGPVNLNDEEPTVLARRDAGVAAERQRILTLIARRVAWIIMLGNRRQYRRGYEQALKDVADEIKEVP